MDKVCAVVVTYNRLNLLKKTIDALKAQSYVPLDILVVNNGSTDDTLLWLNTVDSIQIITQENSGGAGGFYTGIMGYSDGINLDSAVMIRFVEQEGEKMYFKSGGGITCQSDAESEYNEMKQKVYVPIY